CRPGDDIIMADAGKQRPDLVDHDAERPHRAPDRALQNAKISRLQLPYTAERRLAILHRRPGDLFGEVVPVTRRSSPDAGFFHANSHPLACSPCCAPAWLRPAARIRDAYPNVVWQSRVGAETTVPNSDQRRFSAAGF